MGEKLSVSAKLMWSILGAGATSLGTSAYWREANRVTRTASVGLERQLDNLFQIDVEDQLHESTESRFFCVEFFELANL